MADRRRLVRVPLILATCFLLLHLSSPAATVAAALAPAPAGTLCIPRERDALLDFKAGLITDPANFLQSWGGADCCLWTGVVCSHRTGHVVALQINSFSRGVFRGTVGGEIRSSLLTLRHLKQLNLSWNDFGGKPIPEFIGALGSLTDLDLSCSNFSGRIPPQLGNLSNLLRLELGDNMGSYSPDLAWVSRLRKLQILDMSEIDLSAAVHWAHAINMLPDLIELDLSTCGLRNTMPPPLQSNLTSLETLDLSSNPFNISLGAILVWDLPNLQVLYLSNCGIHALIPGTVGNLTSLQLNSYSRTISMGTVGGERHFSMLTLRHLKQLDLSRNDFGGKPIPEFIGALGSLTHLDLSGSNFGGRIPPQLGNLSNLLSLRLMNDSPVLRSYSPDLAWVSRLMKLQYLYISGIDLRAVIDWVHVLNMLPDLKELYLFACGLRNTMPPPVNSNLTSLEILDLSSNPFNTSHGAIFFWDLPRLQVLSLSNCGIHAPIPDAVANLTSLQDLYLDGNQFNGNETVPLTFKKLTQLQWLELKDNFINMDITDLLGRLPTDKLQNLILGNNNLTGSLPAWIGQFRSLTTINLNNNKLSGEIPIGIRELTNLTVLGLNSNNLHGTITEDNLLFGGSQLEILDISSNQLVGSVPTLPKNLIYMDLSKNNLSGALPSDIGAPMLQVLLLFSNSFFGTIPCSVLQLQQLRFLDLSKNRLNRTLPNCPQGRKTSKLIMLNLSNNNLSGAFPLFLQRCRELNFLDLAYNKFSGHLPSWIESKLPQLTLLRLRSNMFSGGIPGQLTMMKGLQYLDIACNKISGNIPPSLGNLIAMTITPNNKGALFQTVNFGFTPIYMEIDAYTDSLLVDIKGQQLEYTTGIAYMVFIDFSCNCLTGQIPKEIGMLVALKNLNLSWNSLSDIMPQSIGALQAVESFDLSHNELSGEIPTSLSALTSLTHLNLSYNNLTGAIPSGNQLRTLDDQASIYIGNPGLCGPPLTRKCSGTEITPQAPKEHEGMSDVDSFDLGMCIGFVVGLWIVFCGFLLKRKWRVGCFSFSDHMYDWVYVQLAVGLASLARKIRRG